MYKSFALKDTTTIQSIDKLTNKVILSFYARYVVIYVMENTMHFCDKYCILFTIYQKSMTFYIKAKLVKLYRPTNIDKYYQLEI